MDYEECTHEHGTYTDRYEPGVERCKACDIVMNMTREEFEGY